MKLAVNDRVEIAFTKASPEDLALNPTAYQLEPETGTVIGFHMPSDSRFQGSPPSYMVRVELPMRSDDGRLVGFAERMRVIGENDLTKI